MKTIRITDNSIRTQQQHDEKVIAQTWNYCYAIENLEEEIGIDLITLFKALTKGFYYNYKGIRYIEPLSILLGYKGLVSCSNIDFFDEEDKKRKTVCKYEDYGKTWALTKEELENEEH